MGALLTITDIERIYGSPLLEDFYSELGYMMIVSIQYPSSYYQRVLFYPTLDIYCAVTAITIANNIQHLIISVRQLVRSTRKLYN